MKPSRQATRGHLIVGAILVVVSLASAIACLSLGLTWLAGLVFFFGVWGGVELGRYLEFRLSRAGEEAQP
jgi:hypothetical protein